MNIAPKQMKRLHMLLNRAKLMKQKADLVTSFTGGRTEHSSDMTYSEADSMISWLLTVQNDAADRQRKLILHLAHQMNWEYKDGSVDTEHVNDWCIKYGQFHKTLNEHDNKELPDLVTQFSKYYKWYLSKV